MTSRHTRFLAAFGIGALVSATALVQGMAAENALLAGANACFILYLALIFRVIRASGPVELRLHAGQSDEGVALILVFALMAVVASIAAIFLVLNTEEATLRARVLALASLPLGWLTVHVLAALHYAHLHYRDSYAGMVFPGRGEPDAMDFLYASVTIGMTAQVSDVTVQTRPMRHAVLVHGIASFFYNTCILAVAVNAAVTAGA